MERNQLVCYTLYRFQELVASGEFRVTGEGAISIAKVLDDSNEILKNLGNTGAWDVIDRVEEAGPPPEGDDGVPDNTG